MSAIETLARDLEREGRVTRRFLEALAQEKLGWRPHPKARTLGELAAHVVQCFAWPPSIFAGPALDFDPATFPAASETDAATMLADFDTTLAASVAAIRAASDDELEANWALRFRGRQIFDRRRADVMRNFVLDHMIHHRGQLSVYLRVADLRVPGAYGPTADD
jgi:uncharacterized damage-inducible protein DinB